MGRMFCMPKEEPKGAPGLFGPPEKGEGAAPAGIGRVEGKAAGRGPPLEKGVCGDWDHKPGRGCWLGKPLDGLAPGQREDGSPPEGLTGAPILAAGRPAEAVGGRGEGEREGDPPEAIAAAWSDCQRHGGAEGLPREPPACCCWRGAGENIGGGASR